MSSSSEIIAPPADMKTRTILENAAKFVANNGLEIESKVIQALSKHAIAIYNSLRCPTDPCYIYYRHKVAEYSALKQDDDYDDNQFNATKTTPESVFDRPPHVSKGILVRRTAFLVSTKGPEFETLVSTRNADDSRFNFLRDSSDPFFLSYMEFLARHRLKNQGGAQAFDFEAEIARARAQPPVLSPPRAQPPVLSHSHILPLPNSNCLYCRIPRGMTPTEVYVVKVTAVFGAWYGSDFMLELTKRVETNPQFEFMKPTDSRFPFYNELLVGFSKLLKPPEDLKEKLRKNPAYVAAMVDGFFHRIQLGHKQEQELCWLRVGERHMVEWHDSVTKEFADKENKELPSLEGPVPQFDESSLIPEDQFLAQHPRRSDS